MVIAVMDLELIIFTLMCFNSAVPRVVGGALG